MKLIRKLYDWVLDKSKHPKASWFLAIISFLESSIFPIPPDIILIPMIIANKFKAWWFAFVCTISSVAGGIAGYCIGSFFYLTIGKLAAGNGLLSTLQHVQLKRFYCTLSDYTNMHYKECPLKWCPLSRGSNLFKNF